MSIDTGGIPQRQFDTENFLSHCKAIMADLANHTAHSDDVLAVIIKFIDNVLVANPLGSITTMRAYCAYENWALSLGATPMGYPVFQHNLIALADVFMAPNVKRVRGKGDVYQGLSL